MQKTFIPTDILLPEKDMEKWAVIACDQYTSDADYWEKLDNFVGETPSALRVVLPEIYLSDEIDERIKSINENMEKYIESDVFCEYKNAFIYLERTLKNGSVRRGIIGAIDLNDYDYNKGSSALIRATEATVLSRIPPRVKIRKDAPLELPHVMLLADDREDLLLSPLSAKKDTLKKVYDFDLSMDAGHVTGYLVTGVLAEGVMTACERLTENDTDKLMFAVGDGNHSLATAKTVYEQNKNELNRYALVEVVNIHDKSLNFEPIYRVLFGVEPEKFIDKFVHDMGGEYDGADAQEFTCVYGDKVRKISIKPTSKLSVGTLQTYLDNKALEVEIDYIHDEEAVYKLCKSDNTLGFIFDSMQKNELFDAVKADGALPRKTFSMGHADDKRFYIEARKIKE